MKSFSRSYTILTTEGDEMLAMQKIRKPFLKKKHKLQQSQSFPKQKESALKMETFDDTSCCCEAESSVPILEQPQLSHFAFLGKDFTTTGKFLTMHHALTAEKPNSGADTCGDYEETVPAERKGFLVEENKQSKAPNYEVYIDCCTCMCCVKALFYHCKKDSDSEGSEAHNPCSCQGSGSDCLKRWCILGSLAAFLPCLFCYAPLSGCAHLASRPGSET